MKILLTTIAASTVALGSLLAGEVSRESYTPQPMERDTSSRFYVAVFGGINMAQTADVEDVDAGPLGSIETDLESEAGWFGGLKFGFVCPVESVVRPVLEIEGFYNGVEANFRNETRFGDFDTSADFHSAVAMANVKVQFDLGRFKPYIGAGAGYAHTWIRNVEFEGAEVTGAEDDEGTFAYQGIAGFDIAVSDRLSVFSEYKALVYHELGDVKNYVNHLLGAGVRIGF
jgi:opacity protein-like surface antigen